MNKLQNNIADMCARLAKLGITNMDALALRRIEMTLHRWHERECNGEIQRDEQTSKPYAYTMYDGKRRHLVPDLEKGAARRLLKTMSRYPQLRSYVQCDPRGCALYILRAEDIGPDERIDSVYTRGISVRT